jgi:hypothetical protein
VRRLALLAAAFALAVLAAGMVVQAPTAQPTSPLVNGVCRSDQAVIPAAELPETVDLEDCPIGGSVIRDHGVGTVLPDPGEAIYVEAMMTDGAQELEVARYLDGTVELEHVGDESVEAQDEPEIGVAGTSPGECSDKAFTHNKWWVHPMDSDTPRLRWYFNPKTTPGELSSKSALSAMRRGTANIMDMQSNCRRGDRVPESMSYEGATSANAQIGSRGNCSGNDGMTVVSFGRLSQSMLAAACTISVIDRPYNRVKWADIMLNKAHYSWTNNPGARSCRSKFDLESVITHERGHTFGLGHVSESSHGKLTMSTGMSACQSSERSLGLGDWLGLERKYSKAG